MKWDFGTTRSESLYLIYLFGLNSRKNVGNLENFLLPSNHEKAERVFQQLSFFFLKDWRPFSSQQFFLQVSWIRASDAHILTVDQEVFISDPRFSAIHQPNSSTWTLQIK